jgi:hypothetical protein
MFVRDCFASLATAGAEYPSTFSELPGQLLDRFTLFAHL